MEITRNIPFHQLSDRRKIEVCLAIFEKSGFDITKQLFTVKVKYLSDLSDSELQETLKTYVEIGDFEKAAYIRDFIKNNNKNQANA